MVNAPAGTSVSSDANAKAWSLDAVVKHFMGRRNDVSGMYPSEWVFLKDAIREGVSVLDVGCAVGGFAGVLRQCVKSFSYTGIDISPSMIAEAKQAYPDQRFFHVAENDFSNVAGEQFDLVLCLGILPLSENWRDTIRGAWDATKTSGGLLIDIRETTGSTLEDKATSYLNMNLDGNNPENEKARLPYNVIEVGESIETVRSLCTGHRKSSRHSYVHPVTGSAICPLKEVWMTTMFITR